LGPRRHWLVTPGSAPRRHGVLARRSGGDRIRPAFARRVAVC